MISEIWSAPNTLISWLSTRPFRNNGSYTTLDGITVYYSDGFFTNFCLGKYCVSTAGAKNHEVAKARLSKKLGWSYLAPYFYAVFLLVRWIMGTAPSVLEFLIGTVGCIAWFVFIEWLTRETQ